MKNFKHHYFAIIAIALLWSCQKQERVVEGEKDQVQFFAHYNETPHTKANAAFAKDNKATIYACITGASPSSTTFVSGTPVEATAQMAGELIPENSLFLPKGSYDFYSVSINKSTAAELTFTSGESGQLANDIDYLWAKTGPIDNGKVHFTYNHKSAAIAIEISADLGVSLLTVTSVELTPSKPDASTKMTLSTGVIKSATQKGDYVFLEFIGSKWRKTMIPLKSTSLDIRVTVNATIGGTSVIGKVYTASIPAMEYTGGTLYSLDLKISPSAITFTNVNLADWTPALISNVTLEEQ